MKRNLLKFNPLGMAAVLVLLSFSCGDQGSSSAISQGPLEPYIEAELFRLEVTYRLLDRYGQELWPGWKDYAKIPVKVSFPNGVVLYVGSGRQSGFERIAGRTVSGNGVFVNRQKRTSTEVRPPLFVQRGTGGPFIELEMGQTKLPLADAERSAALEAQLKDETRPEAPFDLAPRGDSDSHILMYIHELFHGHRFRVRSFRVGERPLRDVKVDAEFASWSHIEGLALRRAYVETRDAEALEFLKDFVVAREVRRARMPAQAVAAEMSIAVMEGEPTYVSLKTAMLLRDSTDKPRVDRARDPHFYGFAYIDGYIDNIMRKGMDFAVTLTEDKRNKHYLYGAYQCFLLDRFAPAWKRGFLEKKRNLDSAMADVLRLSPAEKDGVKKRLPARYGYDAIFSFHENALKK